jgi:phosphoenolpyruvate carboxylase
VKKLTVSEAARMAMAFTVYFELVNLAEETHRVRLLRQRRRAQYTTCPARRRCANRSARPCAN